MVIRFPAFDRIYVHGTNSAVITWVALELMESQIPLNHCGCARLASQLMSAPFDLRGIVLSECMYNLINPNPWKKDYGFGRAQVDFFQVIDYNNLSQFASNVNVLATDCLNVPQGRVIAPTTIQWGQWPLVVQHPSDTYLQKGQPCCNLFFGYKELQRRKGVTQGGKSQTKCHSCPSNRTTNRLIRSLLRPKKATTSLKPR